MRMGMGQIEEGRDCKALRKGLFFVSSVPVMIGQCDL